MSHAPYRSQSTSSDTGLSPISVALLTSGGIMFTSGATAAVLSVPRAVTIAYYLSTIIVVCVSLSLGVATLRARRSNASGRSKTSASRNVGGRARRRRAGTQSRATLVLERVQRLVGAVAEQVSAATNRNQRDRL